MNLGSTFISKLYCLLPHVKMVSTEMGDLVPVQFPVRGIYLGI